MIKKKYEYIYSEIETAVEIKSIQCFERKNSLICIMNIIPFIGC